MTSTFPSRALQHLCVALLATVLLRPLTARAVDDVQRVDHHADHTIMGVKGVSTLEQATTHGKTQQLAGYGVAGVAERTLFHERLSLEVDFVYTAPGDERTLALEPLSKLPWHINRHLEPYAGMGPLLLNIADGHGAHYWLGGGQLVFGALIWFADVLGVDLDVAIGAARGTGMTIYEATFAIGPVMRN